MNHTKAFESVLTWLDDQAMDLGSSDWRTVLRIKDSQGHISPALLEDIGAPVDTGLREALRYAGCEDKENA